MKLLKHYYPIYKDQKLRYTDELKSLTTKRRIKLDLSSLLYTLIIYLPIVLVLLNLSIFIHLKYVLITIGALCFVLIPYVFLWLKMYLLRHDNNTKHFVTYWVLLIVRGFIVFCLFLIVFVLLLLRYGGLFL